MSIEQKAKAYDGALERARKIKDGKDEWRYSDLAEITPALTEIFPELRESEDERRYNKIIDYLLGRIDVMPSNINERNTLVDWLEKKKEPKPKEKQDYSGLNDLERAIHRGFLSAGVENVPVTIIKETAQECLAQMNPAEWSEEDEQFLLVCKNALRKYQISDHWDANIISKWLEERIKSLRPSWKPSEEQMKELKEASAIMKCDSDDNAFPSLKTLYEQLYKL